MSPIDRHLRFQTAVAALPELPDLRPLREALIDASEVEPGQRWGGGAHLSTVDTRAVRLDQVGSRTAELAERVRRRTETVMGRAVAALRALERHDEAEACRLLVSAGEVEEGHGRRAEAEAYYAKALELGRRPRDRSGETLALRRLGRVARSRGQLERAHDLYRESWRVAEDARDTGAAVIGCLGVGHVLADQGRWEAAREWYLRGMEGVDEEAPEFLHLCNALSVVARRSGDLDQSAEWLSRGEARVSGSSEPTAVSHLLHGRAKLLLALGDAAAAVSTYRAALDLPLEASARVVALLNLAEAMRSGGMMDAAESTAREAERLAIGHGDLRSLPHVYVELGTLARARGERDGFVFFEQALDLLRDVGEPDMEVAAVQRAYGLFESAVGEPAAALARLRIAESIYDSTGSRADAEAVAREIEAISEGATHSDEDEDVLR